MSTSLFFVAASSFVSCSTARLAVYGFLLVPNYTVVVETKEEFAHGIGTTNPTSIGIRVPNHKTASSFLKQTGPLAVTSANRSGEKEAKSHIEAESIFKKSLPFYIEGDSTLNEASTVVDLRISGGKILRQGSLLWPPSYC